jgi:BlaI family transcriptional regulator, penicillinase repressor
MDATLGERELDVMAALWRDGAGTVAEVRERLPAALAYNTVLTILRNLEGKGFVGHTAEGRTFRYFPAVTEHAVRGSALSRLVEKLFRGSPAGLVAHLVAQRSLRPDELRALHRLLDERLAAEEGDR